MKLQINHSYKEKGEIVTQFEELEDVEKFQILRSGRTYEDLFIDVRFKPGTKNYNEFKYHCCGIYYDPKTDILTVIE